MTAYHNSKGDRGTPMGPESVWDPWGPHHGPRGIILFQKIILFASPCGYKIKILIKLIQKNITFPYH